MPRPEKMTSNAGAAPAFPTSILLWDAKQAPCSLWASVSALPQRAGRKGCPEVSSWGVPGGGGQAWQQARSGQAREGEIGPGPKLRPRAGFPRPCLSNPASIFISSFLG